MIGRIINRWEPTHPLGSRGTPEELFRAFLESRRVLERPVASKVGIGRACPGAVHGERAAPELQAKHVSLWTPGAGRERKRERARVRGRPTPALAILLPAPGSPGVFGRNSVPFRCRDRGIRYLRPHRAPRQPRPPAASARRRGCKVSRGNCGIRGQRQAYRVVVFITTEQETWRANAHAPWTIGLRPGRAPAGPQGRRAGDVALYAARHARQAEKLFDH